MKYLRKKTTNLIGAGFRGGYPTEFHSIDTHQKEKANPSLFLVFFHIYAKVRS